MKEMIFVNQLGLGDYFITNGLVNHFCTRVDQIFIPVKPNMFDTVNCLYSHNPKVTPIITNGIAETPENMFECYGIPILDADVYMHRPRTARWYRWYYEQFGVDYATRFSYFQLPTDIPFRQEVFQSTVGSCTEYRVVHDMPSTGQLVEFRQPDGSNPTLPIVRIDHNLTTNLLSWIDVLLYATEIHVMDSSVWNLVHSMGQQIKAQVFYHCNRPSNFTYEPWDIRMFSTNTEIVGY